VVEAEWWQWLLSLLFTCGPFAFAAWYFRGQAYEYKTLSDAYETTAWLEAVMLFEAGLEPQLWRIHEDGTPFTADEVRHAKGLTSR